MDATIPAIANNRITGPGFRSVLMSNSTDGLAAEQPPTKLRSGVLAFARELRAECSPNIVVSLHSAEDKPVQIFVDKIGPLVQISCLR